MFINMGNKFWYYEYYLIRRMDIFNNKDGFWNRYIEEN